MTQQPDTVTYAQLRDDQQRATIALFTLSGLEPQLLSVTDSRSCDMNVRRDVRLWSKLVYFGVSRLEWPKVFYQLRDDML